MVEGSKLVGDAFREGLRPPRQMSVSEWADRYRILSGKGSDEQGRYRTSRTPYMREPMDCLSAGSRIRRVVIMAGSQLGKTEVELNWLGYIMGHAPGPTMIVYPRETDAKLQSKQRIDPMVEACPTLRGKVSERLSRNSANTTLLKDFQGGVLNLTGANSAAGLRAMPVRNLLLDEVDEYPDDVEGEGDPVDLARARTRNFAEARMIMVSSPTIEGRSRIDAAYKETDQRVFMVPCPFCAHAQTIAFGRLRWDKDKAEKALPETVRLVCESCGESIREHHKAKMLAAGFWMPRNPAANPEWRGYWLPSTYSPLGWLSWAQIVEEWVAAQGKPTKLKTVVNTILAETYKERGEAPEWQRIYERRETYRFGTVPRGGLFLTAGVDVQQDRLELEVVAWGRELESWSVQYLVLPGDPTQAAVWERLSVELGQHYRHESGAMLAIRAMGVDSSYSTQDVYKWCRRQQVDRVFCLRPEEERSALILYQKAVEVQHEGKRLQRGVKLWHVGTPVAKGELYGFLRLPKPTAEAQPFPAGYCHFPEYADEHFKQLTAEEVVRELNKRGYPTWVWKKRKDQERNERLDCRVYARAAAAILGVDRMQPAAWDRLEGSLGSGTAPDGPRPKRKPSSTKRDDDDIQERRDSWR